MNQEDICENAVLPRRRSCVVRTNNTLAAYDGHTVNVGRIVTDSSFHHFLDLNLLGDPCSPSSRRRNMGSTLQRAVRPIWRRFRRSTSTWRLGSPGPNGNSTSS